MIRRIGWLVGSFVRSSTSRSQWRGRQALAKDVRTNIGGNCVQCPAYMHTAAKDVCKICLARNVVDCRAYSTCTAGGSNHCQKSVKGQQLFAWDDSGPGGGCAL